MMRDRSVHKLNSFHGALSASIAALLSLNSLGASPAIQSARTTLNEGLPVIAAEKVRDILKQSSLNADDRRDATRLLGEALLAAGQTENARIALAPLIAAGDSAARL